MNWNLPTVIVCTMLAVIIVLVIYTMIQNKKKGRSSCGGNCASCPGGCHRYDPHAKSSSHKKPS